MVSGPIIGTWGGGGGGGDTDRFSFRQKIRPRERVYPYDIIVHNGGLEQY